MGRKIVVVGDSTSHGGVVISGSPIRLLDGKPIARLGDMVSCPLKYPNKKPHGINPIIEGEPAFGINGVPVALHGHKTACGCTLNGSIGPMVGGDVTPDESLHAYDAGAVWSATRTEKDKYNQHYKLINEKTGAPLAGYSYKLKCNGEFIKGKTDENGLTCIVSGNSALTITLEE